MRRVVAVVSGLLLTLACVFLGDSASWASQAGGSGSSSQESASSSWWDQTRLALRSSSSLSVESSGTPGVAGVGRESGSGSVMLAPGDSEADPIYTTIPVDFQAAVVLALALLVMLSAIRTVNGWGSDG